MTDRKRQLLNSIRCGLKNMLEYLDTIEAHADAITPFVVGMLDEADDAMGDVEGMLAEIHERVEG